jgi:MFS family permease
MRQRLVTSENRKWWTLAAVALGLFMIMLDNTIVNVALPAIQRDLGAQLSELEWIVAGYALSFAALILTGGKLADLLGRRRIFTIGLAVFGIALMGAIMAHEIAGRATPEAFVHALSVAFVVAAAIALAGALTAAATTRNHVRPEAADEAIARLAA